MELAEQLLQKSKELEDLKKKIIELQEMDIKGISIKLEEAEAALGKALTEEAEYKRDNTGYLASQGSDCPEVKRLIAQLTAMGPPGEADKKLTAALKDNWLIIQRTDNPDLAQAVSHQTVVSFTLETHKVECDNTKRKHTRLVNLLSVKAAQLNFLAS